MKTKEVIQEGHTDFLRDQLLKNLTAYFVEHFAQISVEYDIDVEELADSTELVGQCERLADDLNVAEIDKKVRARIREIKK